MATDDPNRKTITLIIPPSDKPTHVTINVSAMTEGREVDVEVWPGDGTVPPNLFRWAGHAVRMQPLDWRLLDFVLHSEEKSVTFEEAQDAVWGREVTNKAINAAARRVKRVLEKVGYPLTLTARNTSIYFE